MRLFGSRREPTTEGPPRITIQELKRRLDRGEDIVLLDVRQPFAYANYPGAIPGSIRIPPAELPARYGELPRDRLIVAYCT
jgi:sulfur-carrier protein adenylyltransferase/sulfurtransferase